MIDPRISLAGVVPQTQSPQTAINIFESTLLNAQNRQIAQAQEQRRADLAPFALQQAQQTNDINTQTLNNNQQTQAIQNKHQVGQMIKGRIDAGDVGGAIEFLQQASAKAQAQGVPPNSEVAAWINDLSNGNTQGVLADIDSNQLIAQQRGLLGNTQGKSVSQREFDANVTAVKADPKLETVEGKAAAVNLGLLARKSSAASIEIAKDPLLAQQVADSQSEIAGAKSEATEGGKLKQQRKHKPAITALVKLAEKEATERGDTLTALQRSKAALPGLTDAVGQLKELATFATSTIGGNIFDFAVKQTGFGSTKGATAKAKFIAIVNNQVLPLLKETFGAAFTATEGESLKATMGDPDASPEEKTVQLDAFIAQKIRDIETKETQLRSTEESQTLNFDAQGNLIQ